MALSDTKKTPMKWGKPQRDKRPVTNRLRMYAQKKRHEADHN